MKNLIAIDIDGTLRHTNGTISNRVKLIIKDLINKGHVVVLATARPRYHTAKISDEVGMSPYLISSNGAEILNRETNEVLFTTYITNEESLKIYEYCKTNKLRVLFVIENKEYATKHIQTEDQTLLNDDNLNEILKGNVNQVMISGDQIEAINKFKQIVINQYKMNVIDSAWDFEGEAWFSINGEGSSKGNAVITLAQHLNIPVEKTIAIGNDYNDISMLKQAGISVAVANSATEILNMVNIVIKSNDEDGVAIYLESLI